MNFSEPSSAVRFALRRPHRVRAATACNPCRSKKRRCDESRPCFHCKADGIACEYPTARSDRGQEQLEMIVSHLEPSLSRLDNLCQRFESISQALARSDDTVVLSHKQPVNRLVHCDDVHYTGAHHLINRWPAVQHLLKTAKVDVSEDYVLRAEEGVPPSCTQSYEEPKVLGASLGSDQLLSGHHHVRPTHVEPSYWAALGQADLPPPHLSWFPNEQLRQDLTRSYVEHMHILHPILDLEHLERVSSRLTNHMTRCDPTKDAQRGQCGYDTPRQARKRPLANVVDLSPTGTGHQEPAVLGSHPLDDAILLLVLAIGAICTAKAGRLWGDPAISHLPPVSECGLHASDASERAREHASMPETSRSSSSNSVSRDSESRQDCIPGLLYYLTATRILGPWVDMNHLLGAQAFILAGLYKAQLGKVYESMNWITTAGRVCQVLLRRYGLLTYQCTGTQVVEDDLSKEIQSRVKGPVHNLILLCAWTTIQLESDILAELPLVPSGIQAHEDLIPWPTCLPGAAAYNAIVARGHKHLPNADEILIYYSSQLWLRKRLNQIQKDLYGNACLSMSPGLVEMVLEGHRDVLRVWRKELPHSLGWVDDEPPAKDILAARLRAKYLGACFIATRPFLDFVTHILPGLKRNQGLETLAVASNGEPRSSAEIGIFKAISRMSEAQVWNAAEECVVVAAKSTCAFDGIPHQVIVTNVHGTAHAQFGNLLVLSAAKLYSAADYLFRHVDLEGLLQRTIDFLGQQDTTLLTCKIDRDILIRLQTIFPSALVAPRSP